MLKKIPIILLPIFLTLTAVFSMPINVLNGGGCFLTAVWNGTGWTGYGCSKTSTCGTECEYGVFGPIGDPVFTCKCKGSSSLDKCISIIEIDENGQVLSAPRRFEWNSLHPSWQPIHVQT